VLSAGGVFLLSMRSKENKTRDSATVNTPSTAADAPLTSSSSSSASSTFNADAESESGDKETTALRNALGEWITATNNRDIAEQMSFYAPLVQRYYRARNVSRQNVEAEKRRLFQSADAINMTIGALQINVNANKRAATTRFHKRYTIEGRGSSNSGEVVQELDWTLTPDGWKIVSERDVRVIG
jgi:ketosteroid isomerase-like protein